MPRASTRAVHTMRTNAGSPFTRPSTRLAFARALIALVGIASGGSGQAASREPDGLDAWRARHGDAWRLWRSPTTGRAEMLYGGRGENAREPVTDADFELHARRAIEDARTVFGVDVATLALERVQFLPLGAIGSGDKTTVRFVQRHGEIAVEDGFVNVLFDARGRLLSIQSRALQRLEDVDSRPLLDAARAALVAQRAFERAEGLRPTEPATAELAVVGVSLPGASPGRLAWRVGLEARLADSVPVAYDYTVDATSGAILGRASRVHEFEVRGTVRARTTPGLAPDTAGNAPVATPQRWLTVTSSAGTVTTDAAGRFSFPGVNSTLSVTVTFDGTFNDVSNQNGADYALTTSLPPNQDNTITMNPSGAAEVTAQANAFQHVNALRDWVRAVNPTDSHADQVARANVNINSSCNAYYNGGSTNYFLAQGACVNTAYSTVIGHENGHWLNSRYGTGNGADGMGEGNADVFAMYCYDTPIVGLDFCGSGCGIRSGWNTRAFCGDPNPACYGEVHADGEPWMGAAWKIRDRLNASLGGAQGDLVANSLFLAWMNAYNQGAIQSVIETQWVVLDDDDGDVDSGSPHFADIDGGFRAQGFPGIVLRPITVEDPTLLPDVPADRGPYGVEVTVLRHQAGTAITSVDLAWRVSGGAVNTTPMVVQAPSRYGASIPRVAAPARVEYWITVRDDHAHVYTWPDVARASRVFRVGAEVPFYFEDFESGANGWTHGSYGDTPNVADDWQFGTPAGKSFSGNQGLVFLEWREPAYAFSGTHAFGNDLGLATDGFYGPDEHVWLRSPTLDASNRVGLVLRFRRWLTVWSGNGDTARVRVNGAIAWTNEGLPPILDDNGWSPVEIDIASWADGQSALVVEFELRTNSSVQCGGWNIDDVQIVRTGAAQPPACPPPVVFGPGKLNSTGETATLSWLGTPSPGGGFQLALYGAPANQLSVVYASAAPGSAPFLNGTLLLQGPYARVVAWTTSVLGDATANLPVTPSAAGTTRFFQALFRDPSSPDGSGFGLSRALRVDYCP